MHLSVYVIEVYDYIYPCIVEGHVLDDDMCRRALNRAHKKVVAEMDPDVVLNELRNSGFLPQGEYEDLMVSMCVKYRPRSACEVLFG